MWSLYHNINAITCYCIGKSEKNVEGLIVFHFFLRQGQINFFSYVCCVTC